MTGGRGFIALAAMIFGRWTPLGAFGAALLFSSSDALRVAIGLTPPTGQLGDVLRAIPPEFFGALPYIVTIVVLVGGRRRSVAPAADGQPYVREARTLTDGRQRSPSAGPGTCSISRKDAARSPVLDDAGIGGSCATPAGSRSSARRRTPAGRPTASSAT